MKQILKRSDSVGGIRTNVYQLPISKFAIGKGYTDAELIETFETIAGDRVRSLKWYYLKKGNSVFRHQYRSKLYVNDELVEHTNEKKRAVDKKPQYKMVKHYYKTPRNNKN